MSIEQADQDQPGFDYELYDGIRSWHDQPRSSNMIQEDDDASGLFWYRVVLWNGEESDTFSTFEEAETHLAAWKASDLYEPQPGFEGLDQVANKLKLDKIAECVRAFNRKEQPPLITIARISDVLDGIDHP